MLGKDFGSKLVHPLDHIGQWFQTPHKETPVRKDHRAVIYPLCEKTPK
jgi:hypothetical protein